VDKEEEERKKREEEEKKRVEKEEEERKKKEEEDKEMLEAVRREKEAEAAALRETLGADEKVKFDEMVGRGMLLGQIMLYFLNTEEEKAKVKQRISVLIEDVDVDAENSVVEDVDCMEVLKVEEVETSSHAVLEKSDANHEKSEPEEAIIGQEAKTPAGETEEETCQVEVKQEDVSTIMKEESEQEEAVCDITANLNPSSAPDATDHTNLEENTYLLTEGVKTGDDNVEAFDAEDEANDEPMSTMSYLDEDKTLLQEVEKSDMVTVSDEREIVKSMEVEEKGVKDKVNEEATKESKMKEEVMVQVQPAEERSAAPETAGNGGEGSDKMPHQDGPMYVSIVDRMLGISGSSGEQGSGSAEAEARAEEKDEEKDERRKEEEAARRGAAEERRMSSGQMGLKVAMDRVLREKSAAKEMSVPRELASQLLGLSSANISAELKQSCSNIVARSMAQEENSEKKYLLSRLEELLRLEKHQVNSDLKARRKQLVETRGGQKEELSSLQQKHEEELVRLRRRHAEECRKMEDIYLDKAEHLRKEVELLENEMESMNSPSQLASLALDPSLTLSCSSTPAPQLTELEEELQCCGCRAVCRPPTRIYQCSEGDLLCSSCLPPTLTTCPECGHALKGQTSRNKVLEKLAVKYFSA